MGTPFFKIRRLCEQKGVAVFSTNFSLYNNISDRVMRLLKKECPEVEVYSVDEAFIDLSGVKNPDKFSRYLKDLIYKNIGIPVSIGVGPTKVLSKVANKIGKKSKKAKGIVILNNDKLIDIALSRTCVEDLWGVGRANITKMKELGIYKAIDLKNYQNDIRLRKVFSILGLRMKKELEGIKCFPFNEPIVKKKEIMCSRTFGDSIFSKIDFKKAISNYVSNASKKLRAQDSKCLKVSVFARTNTFKNIPQYYMYGEQKLTNPTSDTLKLIKVIHELIDQYFREGFEYKKAGARISGFMDTHEYQVDLLDETDSQNSEKLMKVMDFINNREGEKTIKSLACGVDDKAWKMNRNFKSPRYTTSWEELFTFN